MASGCLVAEDIIVTAGQVIRSHPIDELRFIFGYQMEDGYTPSLKITEENIYRAADVFMDRKYLRTQDTPDWALVKLDRKVIGRTAARLSTQPVFCDQAIYVIGHPLGLPLKFASGASVLDLSSEHFFDANLNIYAGNNGSPVFDLHSHHVIGMVVYGASPDFRWLGKCFASVIYPSGKPTGCIRATQFIDLL